MKNSIIRTSGLEKTFRIFNYALMMGFCLTIILPYLNIISLAFNDGSDASRGGIYFWPRVFTLENFTYIFHNKSLTTAYFITISKTVIGTFFSVLLTSMAAYGLKYKTLPGRNAFMFIIFFTTLFGGGMIPYFILLKNLHLTRSFLIYILPALYNVFNIIIVKTYFQTISPNIEESAEVDGCNEFRIFFQIIIPLSKPVIAVIALFNGVGQWNDWATGTFYVQSEKLLPVQTLLQKMLSDAQAINKLMLQSATAAMTQQSMHISSQSLQMAMIIICTLPIICIYPFVQKYFVQGVMIGSIKE